MNLQDLKKKIVFITGSDKGLGKKFVEHFAINGSEIISCSRQKNKKHEEFCDDLIRKYNVKVHRYYFDLENVDEFSKNLQTIISTFSKIDILINNAGINFTSLIEMTSLEKLKKIYDVNFFSSFLITQKLLRLLKKSNSASIINISSTASIENNIGRFAYSSSKVLLNAFTKTLSKEVGRFKIRVNAVAPGLTNTDMMTSTTSEKNINETIKRIPLSRIAKQEEIANLVLFLGSENSSYINGQIISIDGGLNEGI
jgi:3-oxoacyl-[acyl-carrier protein] reductase